ncbi:hypothetical protein ACROYT_G022759 [Oculina patagonica]
MGLKIWRIAVLLLAASVCLEAFPVTINEAVIEDAEQFEDPIDFKSDDSPEDLAETETLYEDNGEMDFPDDEDLEDSDDELDTDDFDDEAGDMEDSDDESDTEDFDDDAEDMEDPEGDLADQMEDYDDDSEELEDPEDALKEMGMINKYMLLELNVNGIKLLKA